MLESSEFEYAVISDRAGFLGLQGEWHRLELSAANHMHYFQTFDWNWKWFEHICADRNHELLILTARRHGRLALVWPLMKTREAGLEVVRWLTEPEIQYGDVLIDRDLLADELLREAWTHLEQHVDFDLVQLSKVLESATAYGFLTQNFSTQANLSQSSQLNVSHYAAQQDYLAALGKTRRRRHTQRRNKLERQGSKLSFHVHEAGPDYSAAVETAFGFKREWLRQTGLLSRSIFRPETERFIAELASYGPDGASAIAAELKLDGRTVAVETGFVFKNHYYSYLGAFDWSMRSFSPGKVLLRDMICWCIDKDLNHYDFLGTPAAYKSEWTDETIGMRDFCHARSVGASAYAHVWLRTLRPFAKNAFERLSAQTRVRLLKLAGRATTRA